MLPSDESGMRLDESVVAPVVTYNFALRPEDDLSDISETVRIQPDDWPAFADLPRALKSLAREHENLRNLVVRSDMEGGL